MCLAVLGAFAGDNTPVIEVFIDYIGPWCYLDTVRIERLQQEHGVVPKWSVFPLHTETPEEGKRLVGFHPYEEFLRLIGKGMNNVTMGDLDIMEVKVMQLHSGFNMLLWRAGLQ